MTRTMLIGAGLPLTLAIIGISDARAEPTAGGASSVLVGDGEDLRRIDKEVQAHKAKIAALEARVPEDCKTSSNACDATVAKLRREHEALAVTVGELDTGLKSVQVYLYGVGGTSTAPKAGSLEDWRRKADARLVALETEVKLHKKTLYEDWDGDGVNDGGLVAETRRQGERLDAHDDDLTEVFGEDIDGDGYTDGLIEDEDEDGNTYYRRSLSGQVDDSRDEIWVGLNTGFDFRKGYDATNDANDVPSASWGGGLSWWYQNHRMDGRATLGVYGFVNGVTGSGFSSFAGPTVTTNWSRPVDLSFGAGVRYTELGSFDGTAHSLRSVGGGFPVLVSYRADFDEDGEELVMFYGSVMPTVTYDSAAWGYGVFAASTLNAGVLVRF